MRVAPLGRVVMFAVAKATIPRALRPRLFPLFPLGVQRSVMAKSHEYQVSAEAAKWFEEANVSVQPEAVTGSTTSRAAFGRERP